MDHIYFFPFDFNSIKSNPKINMKSVETGEYQDHALWTFPCLFKKKNLYIFINPFDERNGLLIRLTPLATHWASWIFQTHRIATFSHSKSVGGRALDAFIQNDRRKLSLCQAFCHWQILRKNYFVSSFKWTYWVRWSRSFRCLSVFTRIWIQTHDINKEQRGQNIYIRFLSVKSVCHLARTYTYIVVHSNHRNHFHSFPFPFFVASRLHLFTK